MILCASKTGFEDQTSSMDKKNDIEPTIKPSTTSTWLAWDALVVAATDAASAS